MCKIYLCGVAVPGRALRVTSATCHLLALTGRLQFTHRVALHFKGAPSATSCSRLLSGPHRGEIRASLRKTANHYMHMPPPLRCPRLPSTHLHFAYNIRFPSSAGPRLQPPLSFFSFPSMDCKYCSFQLHR